MSEVVKVCKVHGELTREQCYIKAKKYLRCRSCKRLYEKTPKSKERRAASVKLWREKYPEKAKSSVKKYRQGNYEHHLATRRKRIKHYRDTLTDAYLRNKLSTQLGVSFMDVTPELIDLKRASLALKRRIWKRDGNS